MLRIVTNPQLSVKEYMELKLLVKWVNYDEKISERALKQSKSIICAYDDNLLIGIVRLIGDGMYNMVVDLIVHPKYQKKGIGTQLLKSVENTLFQDSTKNNSATIYLYSVKNYEEFYIKNGYTMVPNDIYGSGMRKSIKRKK